MTDPNVRRGNGLAILLIVIALVLALWFALSESRRGDWWIMVVSAAMLVWAFLQQRKGDTNAPPTR